MTNHRRALADRARSHALGLDVLVHHGLEVRLATDLMVLANRSHGTGLVPRMSIRVVAGF